MNFKYILTLTLVLVFSGCSLGSFVEKTSVLMNDNEKIVVGFEKVEDSWGCTKKGEATFHAGIKKFFGFDFSSSSLKTINEKGARHFAKEAKKVNANYVNSDFYTETEYFGVYGKSNTQKGLLYKCKKQPEASILIGEDEPK